MNYNVYSFFQVHSRSNIIHCVYLFTTTEQKMRDLRAYSATLALYAPKFTHF